MNTKKYSLPFLRKIPVVSKIIINPFITEEDDHSSAQRIFYLNLLDIEAIQGNKVYIEDPGEGIVQTMECPHSIVQNIVKIIRYILP